MAMCGRPVTSSKATVYNNRYKSVYRPSGTPAENKNAAAAGGKGQLGHNDMIFRLGLIQGPPLGP